MATHCHVSAAAYEDHRACLMGQNGIERAVRPPSRNQTATASAFGSMCRSVIDQNQPAGLKILLRMRPWPPWDWLSVAAGCGRPWVGAHWARF